MHCLLLITGMSVWKGFAQTEEEMPRKHNHYMYLRERLDGSYQIAYDKQVWLHYLEPYTIPDTQGLRFRVFDDNHSLVVETDEDGIPSNPNCPRVPIEYGDNWVVVNLSSLTSFDQFYTMEVWDSKGETRYLRFLCKSSQLSMTEMEQGWLEKPTFPADTTFSDPRVKKQTVIGTSGSRRYELTDHLGNVMAVYSDRKIGVDTDSDGYVNYYAPEIISVSDYYPYGYPIRERCFSREDYRYGFNDKENDNEVYEPSTFQDYGFRMYDTRVARFWGVDPLTKNYPMLTPFQFASCSPIRLIDMDGQEGIENTIGYTSDGIPFSYFNARQSTYVIPKAMSLAELKKPMVKISTAQQILYQGEVRPAKSEYEKEWEFSAGPFANNIRSDRVLQAISTGGFMVTGSTFGAYIIKETQPFVIKNINKVKPHILKYYNDPKIKFCVGGGIGYLSKKLDISPDVTLPDPIMNLGNQIIQFGIYLNDEYKTDAFKKKYNNGTTKVQKTE